MNKEESDSMELSLEVSVQDISIQLVQKKDSSRKHLCRPVKIELISKVWVSSVTVV